MSIEHILTEIMNRPLFITPDKLSVIMSVLGKKSGSSIDVDLSSLLPALGSDLNNGAVQAEARQVQNAPAERIAVIDALGSLTYRNAGNPGAGSGMRSYRYMQRDIQECLSDDEISAMIIDFNSYGGSAQGCERMARFIKHADSKKPIYAVVDMNCFSAGYYLASACRKVILTDQDCGVGSIGCIAIHRDESRRNAKEGDVYTAAYFGEQKNDLTPYEPLTDKTYKKLLSSVNAFGDQFVKTVAEFRGLDEQKIRDTQAGVYYGQAAIDAGLADHIMNLSEAVEMLAQETLKDKNANNNGGEPMPMTTKDRMEALLAAEDGPEAIAALGYITKAEAEKMNVAVNTDALTKAVTEAVAANTASMIDMLELCQLGDLSTQETVAIAKEHTTADAARISIQELKAAKAKTTVVKSNVTTTSGDGKNPLIAAAEKQAGIK